MSVPESPATFRFAALSVVKHAYVPRGVAAHPRFVPVVVTDDVDQPNWVHERNEQFAEEYGIPYVSDVEQALDDFDVQVAVVSSQAERHCDLSVRAANRGLHVVQDKPISTRLAECDRLVEAVERNRVKFLMWNRNFLPALIAARERIASGAIGDLHAIHVDFYFAKDAGPPKGTRNAADPPMNWLEAQIASHADGSDGGVGREPMGELEIEGIYPLAYIRMLTGANVERVFARTAAHFHQLNVDNDVEDLATVTLEMEHNIVGSLCIGRIGAASHPDVGEIKIHALGSAGGLVISEALPEVGVYYRGQPEKEFRHQRLAIDNDYLLMENFARAIDTDGETILDAKAGRDICATVEAALESADSGAPVPVA
jgi:predicted dehydrogenase